MQHISFVFFGTPYPARDTLEELKKQGWLPKLIVTNQDTPQGRGHVLTPTLTNIWGQQNKVPVLTPTSLDASVIDEIKSYNADVGVCVAYGKLLPASLIEAFPKGILNVHYSLLPLYRGASPVEAALLDGVDETGVTIQRMVPKLDAGDIVAQETVAISADETTKELRPRLVSVGAALLAESLPRYLAGDITPTPQDHTKATHVGKISKEAGLLTLDAPGHENWRKYRAYAEWPGTYFFTSRGEKTIRVKVTKATLTEDGVFTIQRVIPEGKKEMDYAAFLQSA